MNQPTPTKSELIEHFTQHNAITGKLQHEMSKVILEKPEYAEQFKKQSKMSEEQAFQVLLNAMRQVLKVLPLAQANRVNLFCWLAKMHSDLTGNPLMQEVIIEVNKKVHDNESS